VVVAAVWAVAWAIRALVAGRLFPPYRARQVPWTGWHVLAVVLTVHVVCVTFGYWTLRGSGILDYLTDTAHVRPTANEAEELEREAPVDKGLHRAREYIWVASAVFPLQVMSIIGIVVLRGGAQIADLGLSSRHFGQNAALGFLAWMLLAPAILILNAIINSFYRFVLEVKAEEHPLTKLLSVDPRAAETALTVFLAIVAAPVLEELLFRGVLQPWFAGSRARGFVALGAAFGLAVFQRWSKLWTAWHDHGWSEGLLEASAIGFVVLMVPGYFLARELGGAFARNRRLDLPPPEPPTPLDGDESGVAKPPLVAVKSSSALKSLRERAKNAGGAIYATALLFASAHASVWPTPISLFVLALGLGYLAYRTQSVVGCIVMHACFNAITVVVLLLVPHAEKGKEATTAVPAVPPVVYSTTVPGS